MKKTPGGGRNNKNANDLRPERDDKGIKIENRNKREIKFLWGEKYNEYK